jgi:hypothetical protein
VSYLFSVTQQERKAKLDSEGLAVFQVGDQVLLSTKVLLDAADIGKLLPLCDRPFTVIACPSPNAYTLQLPQWMLCSPTVNVDWLKNGESTPLLLQARCLTKGRRVSMRWSFCSTARRRGVSRATSCGGVVTRRRATSGGAVSLP